MKRDNSMDVALRDIDYVRERARASRANPGNLIIKAAVGAGPCALPGDSPAPVCPDYSIDYLCANYSESVITITIAAGLEGVVTFNPLDMVFCPVAVSGRATDAVDATLVRTGRVLNVNVRGCRQLNWQNPADTLALATAWVDIQSEWDPTFKASCKACPVDWSCFTNTGLGSYQLQMIVANPHPAAVLYKFSLWGTTYTCCPGFTSLDDIQNGRRARRAAGPPKPLGDARRSPFAA